LNLNLSVDGLEKLGFLDAHIWPVVIQSRLEWIDGWCIHYIWIVAYFILIVH